MINQPKLLVNTKLTTMDQIRKPTQPYKTRHHAGENRAQEDWTNWKCHHNPNKNPTVVSKSSSPLTRAAINLQNHPHSFTLCCSQAAALPHSLTDRVMSRLGTAGSPRRGNHLDWSGKVRVRVSNCSIIPSKERIRTEKEKERQQAAQGSNCLLCWMTAGLGFKDQGSRRGSRVVMLTS